MSRIIGYTYDTLGRLTNLTLNGENYATYTYDSVGNILTKTTDAGTTNYTYDDNNLITDLTVYSDETLKYSEYINRNADGMVESVANEDSYPGYAYDSAKRLSWSINVDNGPDGLDYTYDNRGNITRIRKDYDIYNDTEPFYCRGMDDVTYTYDDNNRLLTETVSQSIDDFNGNVTTTVLESYVYTYDNNGNMLTKSKVLEDGTTELIASYTYDKLNRLVFAVVDNVEHSYTYSNRNHLMSVNSIYTDTQTLHGYTIYLWDGDNIAFVEKNVISKDGMQADYTADYIVRGNDLVSKINVSGENNTHYYYIQNGHGDVARITDAEGNMVNSYVYDPYGVVMSQTEGTYNPFKYCGELQNVPDNLIYLRNRIYDPKIGRFLTEDPIKDGTNWYVYCGNNPVNYWDKNGESAAFIAGSAIVGGFVGFLSQVTINIVNGNAWHRGVVAAAAGGVVSGAVFGATLNPAAASYAGAAITATINAGVEIYNGESTSAAISKAAMSTVVDGSISFVLNKGVGTFIKTNNGWFQPKNLLSFFTKPYGKKVMQQSIVSGAINATTASFLTKGNINVEMVQEFLGVAEKGDEGYGNYGPKTTQAVADWQRQLVSAGYLKMPKGVAYGFWGNLTDEATLRYLNDNVAFTKVN